MSYTAETRERLVADAQQIIGRYPQARSALLPLLHLVQAEDGYTSPTGIEFCAEMLGLTAAEVSAVATFYTQYKKRPNGEYTVGVCTNTLCAVLGGDQIFDQLSAHLGVGHDETTPDGRITLERVECNAACDYAPVMMVNWEFFDNQTPTSAKDVVDAIQAGHDVAPTRGATKVSTFRETARVLAGFPDEHAGEGVGAGEPSLVGLRLARQNNWTAPRGDEDDRRADTPSTEGMNVRTREDTTPAQNAQVGRGGTVAGKPSDEATEGADDAASATAPSRNPGATADPEENS